MLKQRIDADLKSAMLKGDNRVVTVLRNLKSSILYAEVAAGKREEGLEDTEIMAVLSSESKKRQEAADLFRNNNVLDRADEELYEKSLIDAYLPEPLSEEEIQKLIDKVIADVGATDVSKMGIVISRVKQDAGPAADGALIARLVKDTIGRQ